MKKFFYNLMLLAALIMTSVGMVSCVTEEDNGYDGGGNKPGTEPYKVFVYWISNDLADVVDITTTGLTSFNLSTKTTVDFNGKKIDGVSTKIEFAGDKAKNAEFAVDLKLKSNWKELIKNKTDLNIYYAASVGESKDYSGNLSSNVAGSLFSVSDILTISEVENNFIKSVTSKGYVYKKK